MNFVTCNHLSKVSAKYVVWIRRHVMKLIYCNQSVIKDFYAEF